jgi:hypothetical protein
VNHASPYNTGMSKSKKPDANETAARVVRESTAHEDKLPPNIEGVWEAWSKGVGNVDARTLALLRAAFEVGASAGIATKKFKKFKPRNHL